MNRIEKRNLIHKFKKAKGLQKKKTKGSFGRLPEYIMDNRKNKALKKKNTELVENKQVTKSVVSVETNTVTKTTQEKKNE